MQTSSTLFLLVNFLTVSVTAGISAFGTLPSGARLEKLLQINNPSQETPILSTNRGSGRIDTDQLGNNLTAWRGSGRTQPDPEDRDNNQMDTRLAWRGSGRIKPNLGHSDINQVSTKVA